LLPGEIDEIYPISMIILGDVRWTRRSTSGDPNRMPQGGGSASGIFSTTKGSRCPWRSNAPDPAPGKLIGLRGGVANASVFLIIGE